HSPAELDAVQAFLNQPIVSTQPEFSALHTAPLFDGTLDQAMRADIAVMAGGAPGGGRLPAGGHPAATALAAHGARFGVD
ncbi:hypothetical protein, partial [Clostridium perfringens]